MKIKLEKKPFSTTLRVNLKDIDTGLSIRSFISDYYKSSGVSFSGFDNKIYLILRKVEDRIQRGQSECVLMMKNIKPETAQKLYDTLKNAFSQKSPIMDFNYTGECRLKCLK